MLRICKRGRPAAERLLEPLDLGDGVDDPGRVTKINGAVGAEAGDDPGGSDPELERVDPSDGRDDRGAGGGAVVRRGHTLCRLTGTCEELAV